MNIEHMLSLKFYSS